MNVLIIGNGGREHALAWKIAQSPLADDIFVAPGNAGTALEARLTNVDIAADDIDGLINFAQRQNIGMTIVGPEAPLVAGVVDQFKRHNLNCFGPTANAAQLEGSKSFSKDFMRRHHIPSADYASFTAEDQALVYLATVKLPVVIKADGLAAGKGVIIATTLDEAQKAVSSMLSADKFGQAGHKVVIEEFLTGEEASFIVMSDGKNVLPMATSQDHKARDNGDKGPNTGGMGAYSPAPVVNDKIYEKIMSEVIYPTINGMAEEGLPFCGFLYAGLMIDKNGQLKVLEYNVRFGDPETQPIMLRLQSDLLRLCQQAVNGELDLADITWDKRTSLGVVMAAGGYPDKYETGHEISGIMPQMADGKVFHAGTKLRNKKIISAGGRVLCVCALADSVKDAQNKAYALVKRINWQGCYYRTDIGYKALD